MFYPIIILVLLGGFALETFCRSSGAPKSACSAMIPGHPAAPKTTLIPYSITLDKTVIKPGETCEISISAASKKFKGFLMQVRNEKGTTEGHFNIIDNYRKDVQGIDCFKKNNSAITHKNSAKKSKIGAIWEAPEEEGTYYIYLTVVEDLRNYWAHNLVKNVTVFGGKN